ncbi:uncharacterized protein PHACADRAFT_255491 [Phanerochaete carnosa HHB-10118-sp]|uniref:DUF6593 domain-containing protein n=1 Tax=Phanerochaete carnosa (strain HHB-10118-sp) TaxID=650164 RepID=K5W7G3_PHACS|nr:uncharacterized protein PHACADRAFT_255491 [Phanerochaete carnosa HHB-10118-sp]EKM55110.1 hypothetical protein PHACADRAFT_255491 [Phanerochaete carnosa HHB-10118-sp]
MLLKFSSGDFHNATAIDCETGAALFHISTPEPMTRSRSPSVASFYSFASSSSVSSEPSPPAQKTTFITDSEGAALAEVTWRDRYYATSIRIGERSFNGTGEIFDAHYVKCLPDETIIPTQLEYKWRTTPDSLTLLDDDHNVIGRLYENYTSTNCKLFPASKRAPGHNYLRLNKIPDYELLEVLVTFLLMTTLRERMYWITTYVYGSQAGRQSKSPLGRLRKQASRSFAGWREALSRKRRD